MHEVSGLSGAACSRRPCWTALSLHAMLPLLANKDEYIWKKSETTVASETDRQRDSREHPAVSDVRCIDGHGVSGFIVHRRLQATRCPAPAALDIGARPRGPAAVITRWANERVWDLRPGRLTIGSFSGDRFLRQQTMSVDKTRWATTHAYTVCAFVIVKQFRNSHVALLYQHHVTYWFVVQQNRTNGV